MACRWVKLKWSVWSSFSFSFFAKGLHTTIHPRNRLYRQTLEMPLCLDGISADVLQSQKNALWLVQPNFTTIFPGPSLFHPPCSGQGSYEYSTKHNALDRNTIAACCECSCPWKEPWTTLLEWVWVCSEENELKLRFVWSWENIQMFIQTHCSECINMTRYFTQFALSFFGGNTNTRSIQTFNHLL